MSETPFDRLVELFTANGCRFRVVEHESAGKSDEVSRIRGNPPERAVKALVVRATRNDDVAFLLLCLPGTKKANFDVLGYDDVRLASPDELLELTGCTPGTVPPVSFNKRLTMLLDEACAKEPELWFNAGRLDRSICIDAGDYLQVTNPTITQVAA